MEHWICKLHTRFYHSVRGTAIDVGSNTNNNGAAGTSNSHGGLNDGYQGTRIRPIPIMRGTGSRMLLLGGQTPSKASHV